MRSTRAFAERQTSWFTLLRAAVLVIAGLGVSSALAAAQAGTFKLPTEARWGSVTLAAGNYSYVVDSAPAGKIVTVRAAQGNWAAMLLAQSMVETPTINNQLLLTKRGGEMYVSALCLKDPGLTLTYPVPSAKESLTAAALPDHSTVASASTR
ncbi:MAG TPA: hypothetical protein VLW84_12520 [Terriglobales bacterium]|nr:hypothetical protein [Terriglobales bacterium]